MQSRPLFKHKRGGWPGGEPPAPPFTPPVDTTYLAHTVAGPGADNTVNLANWLGATQNGSTALNAPDYTGAANSSNTITAAATTGTHESSSALISAAGWATFGGAFKTGGGTARFVALWANANAANYAVFDLQTGTIATLGGTATATIHPLAGGFYWCTVQLAAQGTNGIVKFQYGNTAGNAAPTGAATFTTSDKLIAGPFACTA